MFSAVPGVWATQHRRFPRQTWYFMLLRHFLSDLIRVRIVLRLSYLCPQLARLTHVQPTCCLTHVQQTRRLIHVQQMRPTPQLNDCCRVGSLLTLSMRLVRDTPTSSDISVPAAATMVTKKERSNARPPCATPLFDIAVSTPSILHSSSPLTTTTSLMTLA